MNLQKQIYVITGGPGFGKTLLIDELRKSGYLCSGEYARELIESQQKLGGEILPWKKPKLFQQEILKQRIAFYESVPDGEVAFADRAIPDQLAFARSNGFGTPEILAESSHNYRYATHVFITPPWPEIFQNDMVRNESFEEAVRIHRSVVETYTDLNYQLIELPLVSVKKRTKFIIQTILKFLNNDN